MTTIFSSFLVHQGSPDRVCHAFPLSGLEVFEPPDDRCVRRTVLSTHLLKLTMYRRRCAMKFYPCPSVKSDVLLCNIHLQLSSKWKEIAVNLEQKTAHLIEGAVMTRKEIWTHDRGRKETRLRAAKMWRQKPSVIK